MGAGLPRPPHAGGEPVPLRQWADLMVGLAHVPPERPTTDPSAQLAIVGDIHLDDRRALLARLGTEAPAAAGDPELVLAAYRNWGDGFVDHLIGDFAFALWDGGRRTLTCVRDPGGTRPLYYHLSPSTFAFASDPEAVLRLPEVPRRLNPAALVDYLYNRYEDEEAGVWHDVSRLPAGTTLTVGTDQARRRRFWHPETVPEPSRLGRRVRGGVPGGAARRGGGTVAGDRRRRLPERWARLVFDRLCSRASLPRRPPGRLLGPVRPRPGQ